MIWRDTVRDSDLDKTAKLVAFVLSTYIDSDGRAFPSQDTLAAGASLSDRAVAMATERLERAGFLIIERSRGLRSHRYIVALPTTPNDVRRSERANPEGASPFSNDQPRTGRHSTPNLTTQNPEGASPESVLMRNESAFLRKDEEKGEKEDREAAIAKIIEFMPPRDGSVVSESAWAAFEGWKMGPKLESDSPDDGDGSPSVRKARALLAERAKGG
jgi:hypothetical protein